MLRIKTFMLELRKDKRSLTSIIASLIIRFFILLLLYFTLVAAQVILRLIRRKSSFSPLQLKLKSFKRNIENRPCFLVLFRIKRRFSSRKRKNSTILIRLPKNQGNMLSQQVKTNSRIITKKSYIILKSYQHFSNSVKMLKESAS